MHGIAERIEDRADLVIDRVGQGYDVEGGNPGEFGKRALHVDTDAPRFRVEVIFAGTRGAAVHADEMAFARNALADAEIADIGADRNDLAGVFMASDHRHGDGLLRPLVPFVDVHVGAADACFVDLHQHVVGPDLGHGCVDHPDAGFGFLLGKRLHGQIIPMVLPASMNAAMAVSISASVSAADIWVRMRAWPLGTTGKKKPAT